VWLAGRWLLEVCFWERSFFDSLVGLYVGSMDITFIFTFHCHTSKASSNSILLSESRRCWINRAPISIRTCLAQRSGSFSLKCCYKLVNALQRLTKSPCCPVIRRSNWCALPTNAAIHEASEEAHQNSRHHSQLKAPAPHISSQDYNHSTTSQVQAGS